MAGRRSNWADLTCPHCGVVQVVPADGISGTCVKCWRHYDTQEVLHPTPRVVRTVPAVTVRCLDCRTEITVAPEARSCWCPSCSRHRDLSDHTITATVAKHVWTLGTLTVEKNARLINTRTTVGNARILGGFEGQLHVEGVLELGPAAVLKAKSLHVGTLRTMEGSEFVWPESLEVLHADVGGAATGRIRARGVVRLRSGARFFGDILADRVRVDEGAVLVGQVRTGTDWLG